jgi:aspartate-semialdehyde dehydrogenase
LGADDPLGEAILRLLSENDIEAGEVFPLSLSESEGCVTIRGVETSLIEAIEFDWSQADILVSATRSAAADRHEGCAAKAGCRVIGFGRGGSVADRISLEGALSAAVQRVLAPMQSDLHLESVSVVAMLPVAEAGEAGVAELAAQTHALFAMESVESEVFPLRIAFNLIPQVGPILQDGSSRLEQDTCSEIKTLLSQPDLPVAVTAIWAPLFYGAGVALHVRAGAKVDLARLRQRLADQEGVTLMDTPLPGGVATPATDAQDSDAVFVSRLRSGADADRDVSMWLVIDTTRLEATRMVDCLENLIEK